MSSHFSSILTTGRYQVLPLRAKVDLGAMVMKGYSAFPKAPALLEPDHQIVWCHMQDTRCWDGRSYPSVEMQSVYSTAPVDRARWTDYFTINSILLLQRYFGSLFVCLFVFLFFSLFFFFFCFIWFRFFMAYQLLMRYLRSWLYFQNLLASFKNYAVIFPVTFLYTVMLSTIPISNK